eukprot:Opistho-2@73427
MADISAQVEDLKKKGNTAFSGGDHQTAVRLFTDAIKLDPSNHVLFSNRSAAYASLKQYEDALNDANETVRLKPDWAKGYSRQGAAFAFLRRYEDAAESYQRGLQIEPENAQLKAGLEDAERVLSQDAGPGADALFGNMFQGDVFAKLAANPTTAKFLAEKDFVDLVNELQRNPKKLGMHLQDRRVLAMVGALMGIDTQSADDPMDIDRERERAQEEREAQRKKEAEQKAKEEEARRKAEEAARPLTEEDKLKQQALKEKDLGNDAYKRKSFEEAIKHYDAAIALDATNMTFYTNRAAVFFETGDHAKCIADCEKAIEVGREHKADYTNIAKAYARMGNSYLKQDKLDEAFAYFSKSLSEHRTPEVLKRVQQLEKQLKEKRLKDYIDPEKAAEEREKGNELFKKGDFVGAIQHYSEAVKRNPEDARVYSNRAACYTKLMEYSLGLKDCEECLKRDPKFVKGYTRRGAIQFLLKEYYKALEAYETALSIEPGNKEAEEGRFRCFEAIQQTGEPPEERAKRAMHDPEIQEIMKDPIMRQILEQMKESPAAAQDHLKNPIVAQRIQKLVNAGIIQMR